MYDTDNENLNKDNDTDNENLNNVKLLKGHWRYEYLIGDSHNVEKLGWHLKLHESKKLCARKNVVLVYSSDITHKHTHTRVGTHTHTHTHRLTKPDAAYSLMWRTKFPDVAYQNLVRHIKRVSGFLMWHTETLCFLIWRTSRISWCGVQYIVSPDVA